MAEDLVSVNPARPGEVVASFPTTDEAGIDAAVERVRVAQHAWSAVPVPARAEAIAACGAALAAHKGDLARLVSREVGKVLVEAAGDVQEAIDMAAFVAGLGRAPWGETVPCEMPDKLAFTTRHPVGIVATITPWNFPVAIPSWKVFPALLAGNGVVIKPSEHAPACCETFVELCTASGIPRELVQVVHGGGEAGALLTRHRAVRAVSFTGSVPTGRKVAAAAMECGPKLVSLELGGKNAMIVLDDADLDLVVDGAVFGAFGTSGQRCTSTSRLVVQRGVHDGVVDRVVHRARSLVLGDPTVATTDVGPVIDRRALDRIDAMVRAAVDEGASIVAGGEPVAVTGCEGGSFYAPTVLVGVERHHRIAREEVFGPVLAVMPVDDFEEAVDTVNDSRYGLSAAIYTRDVNAAMRATQRLDTGIVYVNAPTIGAEIQLPFGGTKHTGNGYREAGRRGVEQFSETKTVYVDYSGRLQRAQIDNRPPV